MNKILVPTDFSLQARWAAEEATRIALRSGGELVLLHVIQQPMPQSFNVQGQIDESDGWEDRIYMSKLIENKRSELQQWASHFQGFGVNVIQKLRLGNCYHGISDTIVDEKVDLVVMGRSGHTVLEQFFLGSNTDRVVRFSRCPVLTVSQKPSRKEFKDIVYATSLREEESAFAPVITTAQALYDSTVHVVRVNTPENFIGDREARRLLNEFAARKRLKKYTLNIFNDFTTEEGILTFAESIKADLIGISTHWRSSIARLFFGSVSRDVISHSDRPVLTLLTGQNGIVIPSILRENVKSPEQA